MLCDKADIQGPVTKLTGKPDNYGKADSRSGVGGGEGAVTELTTGTWCCGVVVLSGVGLVLRCCGVARSSLVAQTKDSSQNNGGEHFSTIIS